MHDLRERYRLWYEKNYDQLLVKLQKSGIEHRFLDSLFPALELAALKHFENQQPNLLDAFKWNYFMLWKKEDIFNLKKTDEKPFEVLLWPSQMKHFTVQLPVYHALKKQNVHVGFVTNTLAIQDEFIKKEVDHLFIYKTKKKLPRFKQFLQNLNIVKHAGGFELFNTGIKTISFKEIIKDTVRYRIPDDQAHAVFSLIKGFGLPKIVFFGYSFSTVALALDKECKEKNIVTASLQMGRMMYYLFKYSCLQVFYAYGKEVKTKIEEIAKSVDVLEVGSLKIEVTGYSAGKEDVESLVLPLKQRFKKVGLVAFSGPGLTVSFNGHTESLKALKASVDKFKEVFFIIKLHLKDKRFYYTDFENIDNVLIIDGEHPLFKFDIIHLVKQSDFVISGASTSLIESAYWMKPVISVDITGELQGIDLLQEDFIQNCRSQSDLMDTITSILNNDPGLQARMASMKTYIENAFKKDELQPSELVALDVVKRLREKELSH